MVEIVVIHTDMEQADSRMQTEGKKILLFAANKQKEQINYQYRNTNTSLNK